MIYCAEDAYSNEDEGEDDDPWTDDEDVVKRRRSYTREHKLAAIAFALRADFKYADGSVGPISRYAAAKKLGITTAMMCRWINARDAIADTKKGTGKHVPQRTPQEPALELQLTALFKAKRESGRQINARWFFRDARIIYGAIYPNESRYCRLEGSCITPLSSPTVGLLGIRDGKILHQEQSQRRPRKPLKSLGRRSYAGFASIAAIRSPCPVR